MPPRIETSASARSSSSAPSRSIGRASAGEGAKCRSVSWSESSRSPSGRAQPSITRSRRKTRSPARRGPGRAARSRSSAQATVEASSCPSVRMCEQPSGPPISASQRLAKPRSSGVPTSAWIRPIGSRQLSPLVRADGSKAIAGCAADKDSSRAVSGATTARSCIWCTMPEDWRSPATGTKPRLRRSSTSPSASRRPSSRCASVTESARLCSG